MKILYIGNKLKKHGYNPTSVETLGKKLGETYCVTTISDKKNTVLRLIEMIWTIYYQRRKTDIILVDIYSSKAFYYALFCAITCSMFKKKYVNILHGGNLPLRIKKSHYLSEIIFKNAAKNIAPSLYMKKRLENTVKNFALIPNFINLSDYKFQLRSNCSPKLFWVRSFDKTYNPEMAIKVLSSLKLKFSNAKLCMVGPEKDGSMMKCKSLARQLGISDSITFMGYMEKKEWIKLSEGYDIFINTTNHDNLPVSVIEAMALGFPIVSTDAGGLKYLHQDEVDAFIVERNSFMQMEERIISIINDESISKSLSINARKKAEDYAWSSIGKKWKKLFETL